LKWLKSTSFQSRKRLKKLCESDPLKSKNAGLDEKDAQLAEEIRRMRGQ